MALWRLVQWVGQMSPAQLNLVLGVEPPDYILADEKHTRENGERTYVPMIYEAPVALIWWIDYLDSVSEEALRASFERFKAKKMSIFARYGATDFRPRWATRRDGARETPAEKVVDGMRSLRLV